MKYGFLYEGRKDGLDIYRLDIHRPDRLPDPEDVRKGEYHGV